jgi:hypothetical protein
MFLSQVGWDGCQIHSEAIRPLAFEAVREGICFGRVLGNLCSFRDFHPTHPTWSWYTIRVACLKPATYLTIYRSEACITIGIVPRQVFRGSGEIPGRWPTCLFRIPGRRRDGSCRSATLVRSFHHLRRLLRGKCTGIGATTTQELVVHRRAYCLVDRRLPSMVGSVEGILLSRAQAQPSCILSCLRTRNDFASLVLRTGNPRGTSP